MAALPGTCGKDVMPVSARAFAVVVVFAVAGCAGGSVRDSFVAGWQDQRDAFIARFVHANFVQEKRWIADSEILARSGSTDWPAYAGPTLAAAMRAQALSQDRGRAETLERFLAHMRTTPTAAATAEWFADEAVRIRESAQVIAATTDALVAELDGGTTASAALLQRISAAAGAEGRVRGRALQYADLRRTARLYFDARDDDVVIAAAQGAPIAAAGGDRTLLAEVNRILATGDLRATLLRPYRCERADAAVYCAPGPPGATGLALPPDRAPGTMPADDLIGPADDATGGDPDLPRRDIYEGRYGW